MHGSIWAAALALAAAEPAAGPSAMAPAFGNTVVSTYPDGLQGRMWFHEDGSWRAVTRHGKHTSGRWQVKGAQVCMKQSRPIPIPFSYCTPLVAGGVGANWAAKAPTGEAITVHLAAGDAGDAG